MNELIINFTPNGMVPTKEMTPHVPITPTEIANDVHDAMEIGITMLHLHARDPATGIPTCRAEVYGEIIERIRIFAPDLIICVSLSGRHVSDLEQRAEPLLLEGPLKPDMGSLTLSSMNFSRTPSASSPAMIQSLARLMQERGVLPELEVFDIGMINYAHYLIRKQLLQPPHYFNLLLGNIASAQADLLHLGILVRDLPADSLWSLTALGDPQLAMNTVAIACGGGVRVGLEDNIWFDQKHNQLARNRDLVKRVHALAEISERSIMKPERLRDLLQLEPGSGRYGRRAQPAPAIAEPQTG